MNQIHHITILNYCVKLGTIVGEIDGIVNLLRELNNTSPQVKFIDLCLLGESRTGPGGPLQILQLNLVTEQGRAAAALRPVVQEIEISTVFDLDLILSQLITLDLSNVTHFKVTNVHCASRRYLLQTFTSLGASLRHLELGPWFWHDFPSKQVLINLPRLESLMLNDESWIPNYDKHLDSREFQALLDTFPAAEGHLCQLSRLYLFTERLKDAEVIIQFVRLYNTNAVREGKRLELTVSRKTFKKAKLVVLRSMTRLIVIH